MVAQLKRGQRPRDCMKRDRMVSGCASERDCPGWPRRTIVIL